MSNPTYTRTPPTEPGWYWWKHKAESDAHVVNWLKRGVILMQGHISPIKPSGLWGPRIEPPQDNE
jgi:hypothetical protein